MYRPEGWLNPYLQQDDAGNYIDSRVYEAGTDAMLKALKADGEKLYMKVVRDPDSKEREGLRQYIKTDLNTSCGQRLMDASDPFTGRKPYRQKRPKVKLETR